MLVGNDMCDGVGYMPLISDFGVVSVLVCPRCANVFEDAELVDGVLPPHKKENEYDADGTV